MPLSQLGELDFRRNLLRDRSSVDADTAVLVSDGCMEYSQTSDLLVNLTVRCVRRNIIKTYGVTSKVRFGRP